MMKKLLALKPLKLLAIYVILDTICVGMGLGVPIFCILFGFIVGWYCVYYNSQTIGQMRVVIWQVLLYATITAMVTLLGMLIIWGPMIAALFDPRKDLAQTGIPMILYEPSASFIGWLILMIVISPVLQLLTTVFGSYLALFKCQNLNVESKT